VCYGIIASVYSVTLVLLPYNAQISLGKAMHRT